MTSREVALRTTELTLPSETEVVPRRGLNGRRELVRRAWTDPRLHGKWLGADGLYDDDGVD